MTIIRLNNNDNDYNKHNEKKNEKKICTTTPNRIV